MLLEGAAASSVEGTRQKDYCTSDVAVTSLAQDRRLRDAYDLADPEKTFHHRAGPLDRSELLRMRLLECLIHAWDLSQALETELILPDRLSSFALSECRPTLERLALHGFYSPLPTTPEASNHERLLAAAGRRAALA
ncbi:hypothetical protein EV651_11251 [Kribbella sp. VKM Ac-2571]|nr:hypothetical protein EV651_11251 [Kribbella sp. VKM Ac-2571]